MPNTDIITVSQKIENKEEQKRLIELVKNNLSKNNGAIIRTSAEGKTRRNNKRYKIHRKCMEKYHRNKH